MTHDFAKKTKAKSRRKPAEKSRIPGWIWFVTGLVLGLFINLLADLAQITPLAASDRVALNKTVAPEHTKQDPQAKIEFDFYDLLPERKIVVNVEPQQQSKSPAKVFLLQAGSFRNREDADRLRAELILLGYEPTIEPVNVGNGNLWHRVRVGPFETRSALAKARSTMINNGIDPMLLQRKAES